jgi:hypothetical protein
MHKIILPVDGSASSEHAARYLVGFVRDVGVIEIHLLAVMLDSLTRSLRIGRWRGRPAIHMDPGRIFAAFAGILR